MVNDSAIKRQLALRPATRDDDAFLLDVYASTRDDLNLLNWDDSQRKALVTMQFNVRQRQYEDNYPEMSRKVVLLDELPIGSLLINRSAQEIALVDIALLPEHRNCGIGTQLVRGLLAEAGDAGKLVRLHVFATSPAARLYERLGFSRTGGDGVYLEMIWKS